MQKSSIPYIDPPSEAKKELLAALADCADDNGITLYACCQDALLNERINRAQCVDGNLLAELFPDRPTITQTNPTRDQCGCVASRDIGMYDTCPYGCIYCYANSSHAAAIKRRHLHNPEHEILLKT